MRVTVHVDTDPVSQEVAQREPAIEHQPVEAPTAPASAALRLGRLVTSLGRALSGVRTVIDLVRQHIGH